jgi:phthalate 3,4-dioxygenase alpha subunit
MCFGSTGMFEQDDVENWVSLTNTASGSMARRLLLNSRMGLLEDDRTVVEPLAAEQFHGPARAYVGYNENNQRALLKLWADHLQRVPATAGTTAVGTRNPDGIAPMVQTNCPSAEIRHSNEKSGTPA